MILRDLTANGEPDLDDETGYLQYLDADGNVIPIGPDGEVPEGALEVEFSRLSVIRSPDKVMDQALDEVLTKLASATDVTTDPAGRLMLDGVTVDAPLENLALYEYIMKNPGDTALPDDYDNLGTAASLFGAASDKTTPITIDTLVYSNTILGLNPVNSSGEVEYYNFNEYDYSRAGKYGDVTITWFRGDEDNNGQLDRHTDTVLNAVFEGQDWVDWVDGTDPNGKDGTPDPQHGIDDFVQAADDARAVIDFIHTYMAVPSVGEDLAMMATLTGSSPGYGMAYGADGDCPLADGTCPLLV